MELTEIKKRFFAQYWGQIVKSATHLDFLVYVNENNIVSNIENTHLELKPLSKITDEDALGVANIISETIHDSISKELVTYYKDDILNDPEVLCYASYNTVDFMRKKGYAVIFDGYSVEDLIELGWVKLI